MAETLALLMLGAMNDDQTSHPMEPSGQARGETNSLHRILVVDDAAAVRRSITDTLTSCGYHVDAAEDGVAAWNTLQLGNYDLLVTDNNMPRVSGVDLVRKVRSARMPLPVILVSGKMPTEELHRHSLLHLAGILVKPFTGAELVAAVDGALRVSCNGGPITPPSNEASAATP